MQKKIIRSHFFEETNRLIRIRDFCQKSTMALFFTALSGISSVASADQDNSTVLFKGPDAVVTVADVIADAQAVPEELRLKALADFDQVGQLAEALFVRRTMAAQAKQQGLLENEIAKASLELAADRVKANLLLNKLYSEVSLSYQEKEKYAKSIYNAEPQKFISEADTKASHILLLGDTEEVRNKIDKIYEDLKKGEDFSSVAKEKSEDPSSARSGGDLGYFPKGRMVTEFDHELEKIANFGEISRPFKTKFGWHIVRLDDRRKERKISFDEAKESLMNRASNEVFERLRDKKIEEIKNLAKPDLDAIREFSKEFSKKLD